MKSWYHISQYIALENGSFIFLFIVTWTCVLATQTPRPFDTRLAFQKCVIMVSYLMYANRFTETIKSAGIALYWWKEAHATTGYANSQFCIFINNLWIRQGRVLIPNFFLFLLRCTLRYKAAVMLFLAYGFLSASQACRARTVVKLSP